MSKYDECDFPSDGYVFTSPGNYFRLIYKYKPVDTLDILVEDGKVVDGDLLRATQVEELSSLEVPGCTALAGKKAKDF